MRRIVTLISVLGLCLLWAAPLMTNAKDLDDLLDAHPLGPYDEISCNGAIEDQLDTGDPAEDFFPPFEFDTQESHNDGGGSFSGQYDFPFSDNEVFQKFNRESEEQSEPRLNITLSPQEVEQGQDISITASLSDFKDNNGSENDQRFAVSFAMDEISLQGIQAGGKKLPESVTGSACGLVTRTPQVDEDNDGMDDNWEVAHGLNPNNPGDALTDADGDSHFDFYTNVLGEVLEITPETAGGPTGIMNNLAEYIWDTDPNRADTDGDGIEDGMEIIGFGGSTVTAPVVQPVGSAVEIRAYAVGLSTMQDAAREFEHIVKIDTTTKTFFVSNGEHLEGQVTSEDDFTVPGETTVLEASFVGTEAEAESFAYSYEIDGQEVTNPSSARHRLEVVVEPDRVPGTTIPYKIEAVNPATGQLATMRGVIQVGELITLEADPAEPPANAPVTVRALLGSNNDPADYLFEWFVDGKQVERSSGVGRDALVLTAPDASGDTLEVSLDLYLVSTSQKAGSRTLVISAADPLVELEVVPREPTPGDTVTVFARTSNFPVNLDSDNNGDNDATLLSYVWEIDGVVLPAQETAAGFTSVTLDAGAQNQTHTISVAVRSVGPRSQTAEARTDFTTGVVGGSLVQRVKTRSGTLLASLGSALPQATAAAVSVIGVVSLLGLTYWQRQRRSA